MAQILEQPVPNQLSHPDLYHETVVVSGGAPIVLSVWPGELGAPTVVFLPGTMTHPLFYAEFLDGLNQRGLSVVGVHYQGHGHSPRVGSRLGWANLVANATDAVDWAADHLGGLVVLLGSSQGGVLAMAVAVRNRRLALVAAHNVLDPSLPESLMISRLPGWLVGGYRPLLAALRLAARLAPEPPVPVWAYLDLDRVCGQPETCRRFLTDLLGRCYPLGFLAELVTADLAGMRDGSIRCPVLVIAATGDRCSASATPGGCSTGSWPLPRSCWYSRLTGTCCSTSACSWSPIRWWTASGAWSLCREPRRWHAADRGSGHRRFRADLRRRGMRHASPAGMSPLTHETGWQPARGGMVMAHREVHRSGRAGWLRAAVLGADDGIVSTASLVIGVAAAAASQNTVLLAGVAGLVAGATSMAAGEYVSVSSQRDAEKADIGRERQELAADPAVEQAELTDIYVRRGLDQPLAATVAERLMAVDPLGSHVRDELGLQPGGLARPLQAAVVSAVSFAVGAALPLALIVLAPTGVQMPVTALAALGLLALLGAVGARLGGARPGGRRCG